MINPFQWKNGKAMTPEEVDRARQLADAALGRAGDTSPVGHWTQGAARVIDTLGGVLKEKRASKAEAAGLAGADAYVQGNPVLAALLGGGGGNYATGGGSYSGGGSSFMAQPTTMPAAPVGPNMGTDVSPEEMANARGDWNGGEMRPEAFSTFGIGQGPDTQYSAGAATTPTMALDVIKGFEGYRDTPYWDVNAYRTGYGSDTVTLADGSVIPVRQGMKITREDAERDLARRVTTEFMPIAANAVGADAFAALSEPQQAALTSIAYNYGEIPDSVARAVSSGNPQAAAAAIAALSSHNDGINAGRRQQESAMFLSGDGASAGGYTPASGGEAYTGGGMSSVGSPIPMSGGGANVTSALMAAMSDPWVAKKYGPVLEVLMGQEMKRGDMQYEAQLRQSDPMYQAQLKAAEAALQPAPMKPIEVGGVLLDPVTYQPIFDSRTSTGAEGFTLGEGQQRYDANGKLIAQGPQPPVDPTVPTTKNVTLDNGSEVMVQWNPQTQVWDAAPIPQGGTTGTGQGAAKLTESEAKTTLFQTLQTETAPVLEQIESVWDPANLSDAAARSTPIAGNFFKSEEGQMYASASSAWAEGALRISTGAAATEPEIQRIQATYFAQPGDTPAVIEFKKGMREMYSRAINAALGKDTSKDGSLILPDEFAKKYAAQFPPPMKAPVQPQAGQPVVIDGYTIEAVE